MNPRPRRTLRRHAIASRRPRSRSRRRLPTLPPCQVRGEVREAAGNLAVHARVLFDGTELDDQHGRFCAWFQATRTYTFTVVDAATGRTLLVRRKVLQAGVVQFLELRLP